MRIGIDARLAAYREGGITQYTRQLVAALIRQAPDQEWIALQSRRDRRPLCAAPSVRGAALWTPPHHRWEQWTLPLELLPHRLDLIHSPDFIPPLRRPCPAVITVHDLAFLRFPEILTEESRRFYGQIGRAVAGAEGIIAVSEGTRRDLHHLLGVPPERVAVVYHGCDPRFRPPADPGAVAAFCRRRGLPDSFLLWVGTLEPRKNLPVLLEAMALLKGRLPEDRGTLVLAGAPGWREEGLAERVRSLGLADRVRCLGPVAADDLVLLYQAAWVFVFPSRYEGFGLPPVEAMACGTPVVASTAPALPEVLGDAVLYCSPDDPGAFAGAVQRLHEDPALYRDRVGAGLAQAARYRWDEAARQTLAVYRRAVAA
ncbi:MAG: glycosyltransferase family 4 protein [Chloroflexi bacterium]|nr:glycosyltransferase family 4 protein [Chloroflexota bacterium]